MRTAFLVAALLLVSVAFANIEPSCLLYRENAVPKKEPGLFSCPQYRDLSCCSTGIDSLILPDENGNQLYGFNWNRCGNLSDACYKFFQAESCYFECDPYQKPWANRAYPEPIGFVGVPVCASYCNAWFDACKDDFTCGAEWMSDFVKVKDQNGTTIRYDCPAEGVCKKFSDVFSNAQGLCDILWGAAFHYSEDENNCVVWDFGLTEKNPNSHIELQPYAESYCLNPNKEEQVKDPDADIQPQCLPGRDLATPEKVRELQRCSQYRDLSCCSTETDQKPAIYWESCGKLSDSCQEYFKNYECYYECDPYLHVFGAPDFGNPTTPFGVPLCARTCDGWFDACKDDLICGAEFLNDFTLDGDAFKCNEGSVCKKFSEIYDNSQALCDILFGSYFHYAADENNCVVWDFKDENPNREVFKTEYSEGRCPEKTPEVSKGFIDATTALAIILGLVVIALGGFIIFMIVREKRQSPLFGHGSTSVPMQKL